ncbi:ER membrane protein disulfide isomerase Pdi4 [Schizosaccharomyces pombe]|uniref:Thioredoxin domain-containing protein C959.05c n=1 Tax=Schizosaccharomyces pombe (strain 972 / ATCC 24843) TaxID=284812 RepID=YKV5_SCHPO|nr:putative protein disulfide isomerase [Schizosaccharomyces pombe]Q9P4X1.4 RecName: Full=Thioredoxin domain-containing protein C959.05c; AltName: Full=Putative protein disulfide isomerase C959.05c; Flags: Precursor [Schizosaccharomyces pombe 972h-]CAB93012.4 protein disulfide isomerase (predicted) [Schizosaccharomyces pombe]|eukprot:NP_594172.4 putative protein disulfide isomerase [Schizosaccharomyces pombe]
MKLFLYHFTFIVYYFIISFSYAFSIKQEIIVSSHNASSILNTTAFWFVEFTESKYDKEEFSVIWNEVSMEFPDIRRAKVFCDLDLEFCAQQEIYDHPKVVVLKNGMWMRHVLEKNQITTKSARQFVKSHLGNCDLEQAENETDCFSDDGEYNSDSSSTDPAFELKEDQSWKHSSILRPLETLNFKRFLFGNEIMSKTRAFVMFVSLKHCEDCFHWEAVWSSITRNTDERLKMAQVNCDEEKEMCNHFHIKKFPTFRVFQGFDSIQYNGPLKYQQLLSYSNQVASYQAIKIEEGDIESIENSHPVFFLVLYDFATTSEDFSIIERLKLQLAGVAPLYICNSKALANKYGAQSQPSIIAVRNGMPIVYQAITPREFRDYKRITEWINIVSSPFITELTPTKCHSLLNRKLTVLTLLQPDSEQFFSSQEELLRLGKRWFRFQMQRQRNDIVWSRIKKYSAIAEAKKKGFARKVKRIKYSKISHPTYTESVSFLWLDSSLWLDWIVENLDHTVYVDSITPPVFVIDHSKGVIYVSDRNGNSLTLEEDSLFSTLRIILEHPNSSRLQKLRAPGLCPNGSPNYRNRYKLIVFNLLIALLILSILTIISASRLSRRRRQLLNKQPVFGFYHSLVIAKSD